MPYGLKNALRTFQCIINNSLHCLLGNECFVYINDIVIYAVSAKEHIEKLKRVFNRLRNFGFRLQPAKCEFMKTCLTYLGDIISDKGFKPMPEKTVKLKNFPKPTNVKELQRFLGMCTYYNKFIKNYSQQAKPLHLLLQKGIEFKWTVECEKAFEYLKNIITDDIILTFFYFEK